MNEQEAIAWLLDNYPIPFQCSANYVGGAEIGLGTIVNPTPAKVKVGSIIFFADSKVSTVVAVNSDSFVCSEQYNDLVDDVVYVSNVQLNASGHLIVTLSNGTNIDAGLIKQVSGFSINASQHLIVSFNDGTSTDLGAIFSGNITISGDLTVTGAISGNSIIENMSGYSFNQSGKDSRVTNTYVSAVKNGNKVTFVVCGTLTLASAIDLGGYIDLGGFNMPASVGANIVPNFEGSRVGPMPCLIATGVQNVKTHSAFLVKYRDDYSEVFFNPTGAIEAGTYYFRFEVTFLLSNNFVA